MDVESGSMEIFESRHHGVLILAPRGRIDSTTSEALDARIQQRLAGGDQRVVVDFGQVEYISSAGLRVMLALARRLRDRQGTLILCAMPEPVRQVFELAGFEPLFTVDRTREAALLRLAAP
jgi:anti-anti-sigma factor